MSFRTRKQGFAASLVLGAALITLGVPAAPAFAGGASGFAAPSPDRSSDNGGGDHSGGNDSSGNGASGFTDEGGGKGHADGGKPGKAKLKHGDAVAPDNAPKEVVKAIKAANKINKMPYKFGGGHGKKNDKGYDCSGAVSYALAGGKLLKGPEDSSGLAKWGKKGQGDWITVYANSGHAYVVIAGLRFDTSSGGDGTNEDGPRWHTEKAPTKGYEARHPDGL
ncbi:MAG: hypothetical protein QOG62_704 [Thermoleophilaceae bacterium]|jgi:hypothetical protein|nr:hypothetical protein [Thermoleophilaceae bacterium]